LCEEGAVGGIDQRGGAPGTRETDALHPMHLVDRVHGVTLSGGSAFGLDAASGVVRYLEERGVGMDVGVARVPIVPAAVLFDLGFGRADIRPDAAMGYQACLNATSDTPAEGNAGAGMGATVGKALGMPWAVKSGIGSASMEIANGVIVAAIVAVNAYGDVIDPATGQIVAGARSFEQDGVHMGRGEVFADAMWALQRLASGEPIRFGPRGNTVIGAVATNAALSKEQVNKMAQMAQDGLARTIRPAHTMVDGDTIFGLSLGDRQADINIVGAFAAEVFAKAVLRGVRMAQPAGGLPTAAQLMPQP
jgi:L-aminopeptidase/D-esterase-like protein